MTATVASGEEGVILLLFQRSGLRDVPRRIPVGRAASGLGESDSGVNATWPRVKSRLLPTRMLLPGVAVSTRE